jgi:ADP-ribose pyrophosphatase
MRRLWTAYSAPGFCTELLHFYAAEGLGAGDREPEMGEEDMVVKTFTLDDAWAMVERNELTDAKSQIAIAWALRRRS